MHYHTWNNEENIIYTKDKIEPQHIQNSIENAKLFILNFCLMA